jgi:hypothetical protein
VTAWHLIVHAWHFIVHVMGVDVGVDVPYGCWVWGNFWQGFGADLGMIGGIFALYLKHTCHTSGCYRIGRHQVDGTPWCNKHHQQARKPKAPVDGA